MPSLRRALVTIVLLALPASAQEPHGCGCCPACTAKTTDGRPTLAFGAAPAGWTARAAGDKPFAHDFDLPATTEGAERARVNVLYYPVGFEDYRAKILGRWRRQDGAAFTLEDQALAALEVADLKVRTIDQRGTHEPKDGPAHPDWRLIAAHVRAPAGQWTAWLIGPEAQVEAHREAYLGWLRTMHMAAPPAASGDAALRDVRFVHGAPPGGTPGPWALLGQRVGAHALARLGVDRQDAWTLVVTLRAPQAGVTIGALDGLLVGTGASPGKGNLHHEATAAGAAVEVVIVHQPTGRTLTYAVVPALAARLDQATTASFAEVAAELARAPEAEVFTLAETRTATGHGGAPR